MEKYALTSQPAMPVREEDEVPADPTRMHRLATEHFDLLWRSLRRFGVAEHDVEDAVQEALLVVTRKLASVPPERERAFLFAVALRVASSARRARRRHPDHAPIEPLADVADTSPLADELLGRDQARALLDVLLDGLPLELRAVFVLFEIEELTLAEIAGLLGLPIGTVSSRLRRGRELFKSAVARHRARLARGEV